MKFQRLDQICELKKGTSITKNSISPGNIPVIAGGREPAYFHNSSNRHGKTITISSSGAYAGFVNYFDYPIFASDCFTIKPENENTVHPKYIFFFLKSKQERIYSLQTGAAQPHVYPKDLISFLIPTVPIHEQLRIIGILEEINDLRQKQYKALDLTRQMIPALFYEIFGDLSNNIRCCKIVPFCTAVTISGKKINPQDHPEFSFHYLGLENIESGTGNIVGTVLQQGSEIKSLKNVFEAGDVLYGKLRPYLNKVHLAKNSGICSTDILVLKPNQIDFTPSYLLAVMQSAYFLNKASSQMQGANLPRISSESLLKIPIFRPLLEEQKIFTKEAGKSLALIAQQELSLQKLNALFDSTLNQIFSARE